MLGECCDAIFHVFTVCLLSECRVSGVMTYLRYACWWLVFAAADPAILDYIHSVSPGKQGSAP